MHAEYFSLFGFLFIAIFISFLCSILEAVLLSITPSFIASQKGRVARRLEQLKKDIDKPLSAILTLNTFAHTIGAAGVGAVAQTIWGEASLTIVSAVVTILILVLSEIIPKTIGAVYWHQLAAPVSLITQWLTWSIYPIVFLCQLLTKMLRNEQSESILTRKDVSQVVSFGYRDGLIRRHEKEIIDNLIKKDHLKTFEIMTPEERIIRVSELDPVHSIRPKTKAWHVSRIPVFDGSDDNITGYVLKDEILAEQIAGNHSLLLKQFRRTILTVDSQTELKDLYDKLVSNDEHIAVVKEKDEIIGVVTMEDVIEELLGQEIVDESDLARGVTD